MKGTKHDWDSLEGLLLCVIGRGVGVGEVECSFQVRGGGVIWGF